MYYIESAQKGTKIPQGTERENHCISSSIIIIGSGKKTNECRNVGEKDIHCVKVSLCRLHINYNGKSGRYRLNQQ